ncbi:nucleotidyl transferase AbiEii/AbiGii toxin family protein [Mesorhizobium sp. M1E.F.Ca.ET.045.02.1.1]|uniref:nucleotidyl transferase AbiEii/AbiGii toxin family protein n=1 Tax=Mesorhizobium sp. M1E.F.Ca.ET.045.02.1.1 TaxID=2493672 RepID=UPI000F758692|nr:nucleotidyl transferase AbiEii/AbiGii toxin family protein [Mesorhizobium sp. M1E.F.Ca.ET.045.02.1.1]AZO25130.1 nucleotidyl transferase AbiEii/AbiGii toxin family protein [Mesorhizobium sp. M1E.F.Ca.ET.045.02.1.1]TKB17983.1 MAG: nucleotidyl transferase AbiEii/AbiGii toxin family protein [Mesorhizobium sp.]
MIPRDYITEWRAQAPWVQDIQVEQDLVISRALVEIFSNPVLADALAFRGGTALYKLYLKPAARYSEDIDLVQMRAESAGAVMDALRSALDPWLGAPRWKQTEGRLTFVYRFGSEDTPPINMRLKVEINSREHFAVHGFIRQPFGVSSRWYEGACNVPTYALDELLGTKLRALYQRKKGRDLFDLAVTLKQDGIDSDRIIDAFTTYMDHGGHNVTRALFEQNMHQKLSDPLFTADIGPLLAPGYSWNLETAAEAVNVALIRRLPGDAWKGVAED